MYTPLKGFRVLDLTNVLAGPFCCHQLRHLGAEVIKVEVPGRGDLARQLGADTDLNDKNMGISFLAQNAGKKSVTLNLKSPEGKSLFKRLAASADVVVENFRPGVMQRLGLDYETLKADNPNLIYCAISGFGQDGPLRDIPAYDQIVQGMSGVMSITGDADTAPYRVGYPICDTIGGLTAAMAISAALAGRERKGGVFIDVSMLEATLATMGWAVSNWLIGAVPPAPNGNENMTSSPSATFRTGDGLLNIAANKQEQWEALCGCLDKPEWLDHRHFRTREDRKKNRAELKQALEAVLAENSADNWAEMFRAAGIPSGPVLGVDAVLEHPQIADRGLIADFENVPGADRDIRVVRTGMKLNGAAPRVETPPPVLGANNLEIYGALGLSESELETLQAEGVI